MKLGLPVVLLSAFCVIGCASSPKTPTATASDDAFLVQKLGDQAKSKALTDQGIEEYQIQLVKREDFSKVDAVREYFAVALRFDPENAVAAQYLNLVENFKSTRLTQKIKEANAYLAKSKRKEDEDYALCLAVLAAARLDPKNATVARMLKDTSQVRVNLVNAYMGRSKASVAKISGSTPQATRDSLSLEAFQNARKAAAMDPENASAKNQVDSLRQELSKIAARHIQNAEKLIDSGKFEEARAESLYVYELSKQADGAFAANLRALNYSLYFAWAKNLYAKKDYKQAEARINTALTAGKTEEALVLKKSIADVAAAQKKKAADQAEALQKKVDADAAQAEQEAYFTTSLQEIDGLIAQGDLSAAWNKMDEASVAAVDVKKEDQIEARRTKVNLMLKGNYEKAIAAYRAEDFASAINYLQAIVEINVDYEQAADYLEKAKAKQKLVESY